MMTLGDMQRPIWIKRAVFLELMIIWIDDTRYVKYHSWDYMGGVDYTVNHEKADCMPANVN